ncbi:MAG: aldo/keto reductase [Clostridiales bacterium]|jgi:aryl-alcohol dehydrogenase-like predicted oxidoreductase|nr:aldo/keto reductase [Clostridiales bacterium]
MKNRQRVANTDIEIYPIILGSVGAGKEFDEKAAAAIIEKYLDLGGNALDSARLYADGRSEWVIGNWLRKTKRRGEVILITKGGHPRMDTMDIGRMSLADMRKDLEESLEALGTGYIDIYLFHRDNPRQPVEESVGIMEQFVKEGKIRYYGCSNWTVPRITEAIRYCGGHGLKGFSANQMLYNLGSDNMNPFPDKTMISMDSQMKELHRNNPILAMPYFGVCGGFFHQYAAGGEESVKGSPYNTPKNLALAKRVIELAANYNAGITQVVLGFYLRQDFPLCPLYGATEPEQLDDLAGILETPFTAADFIC